MKTPARCVSVDGENDNVDGEHFIRSRDKNAVLKFIQLSVDGKPIRRKSCVFRIIRLSVDVASDT